MKGGGTLIPLLAQNSVDHKIQFQMSVIVGNYEYYYACGIFSKLVDADWNQDTLPNELMEKVQKAISGYTPKGKYEEYLIYLLRRYEPREEDYDDMTRLLFEKGQTYEFPGEEA
jgi:hypothetical protein